MLKIKDIQEGMYIQFYIDGNIYQVYSSYGKLYVDFRGEERSLESFGSKLIYRVYNFEEIDSIGKKVED